MEKVLAVIFSFIVFFVGLAFLLTGRLATCGCGCPLQISEDSFCCPDLLSNA